MTIRPAVVADAGAIAVVQVASWRSAYRGVIPEPYLDGLDVGRRTVAWQQILGSSAWPERGAFVLERGQRDGDDVERDDLERDPAVVGFVHLAPGRDEDLSSQTGEMNALYLLSQHWRHGGGRRLMAAATDSLRGGGFTEAVLWVLAGNERGRTFYDAEGWVTDGADRQNERGGVVLDEIRYRRSL